MEKNEKDLLKGLQNVELDILKEFIRVCEQLNLNYYLIGGTLIGAVRHKGFIPWDDDIDVCMLRKDYEIFLKEAPKYLKSKYFLQTYENDEDYFQCFAKIRNSETTFIEKSAKNCNINHGIYIDIFPMDNYYKYNKLSTRLIKYAIFSRYLKIEGNFIKKSLISLSKFLYGRKDKKYLCRKLEKIYTKANKRKCKKITNYLGAWGTKKETHYIEDFSDYKLADFEGIKVRIPIGFDRCLKDTYGDYMKLPPVEKRVAHHFSEAIDINKSYKLYLDKDMKIV